MASHKFPVVEHKTCIGCGVCVSTCPRNVFNMAGEKSHAARPQDCMECGSCVEACPVQAIKLVDSK
jgi:NAD-dependent dihydropyrimidine dehydrogenase PreA subunit